MKSSTRHDKIIARVHWIVGQVAAIGRSVSAEAPCVDTLHIVSAVRGAISALNIADYQGRTWATRAKPWVDRLATAWLVRRFIDPQARIIWLKSLKDCPKDALGFDFDGAQFSHVGTKVTFEVVATSFGLQDQALQRLGLLVHYLDVGGVQPAEAVGVEAALEGLSSTITDDDQLLTLASAIFDGLLTTFQKSTGNGAKQ